MSSGHLVAFSGVSMHGKQLQHCLYTHQMTVSLTRKPVSVVLSVDSVSEKASGTPVGELHRWPCWCIDGRRHLVSL